MREEGGRSDRVAAGRSKASVTVRLWVGQTALRRGRSWPMLTVLAGTVGLVAVGGWLAVRLIVNPGAIGWLGWLLPAWTEGTSGQPLQTIADITAELKRGGQMPGNAIALSVSGQAERDDDLLLPVCQLAPSCQQIVELRVYRPQVSRSTYALIDRIAVTGPEELAAIAPLPHSPLTSQGSTRLLPLTSVTEIAGTAPVDGIWFHLSGEWQRGSTQVTYGQVIRYDPAHNQLQPLIVWTSPAGQLPHWQAVSSSRPAALVVNQTIGLEPQFQVYQVRSLNLPGRSVQLDAITLSAPALSDRAYEQALLLARSGLWSPALMQLQTYKRQHTQLWTAAAQAQLDVVALHAAVTRTQADRDWASPTQQILALLLDGRWSAALNGLRAAHQGGYDIANLLTVNANSVRKRVDAALQVAPQPDLLRWNSLLIAAQQSRSAAVAWLKHRHADPQLEQNLALLDPVQTEPPAPPVSASPPSVPSDSPPMLIGSVSPVEAVNPADWLTPNAAPLALDANQTWYRIQVFGPQLDQESRSLISQTDGFAGTATQTARLWQLADQPLQVIGWANGKPQTVPVTARAVQVNHGELVILAAGDRLPEDRPGIAIASDRMHWLELPETITLTALSQQPDWQMVLPALRRELPVHTVATKATDTDLPEGMGTASIALADVTGDAQVEAILTLPADRASPSHTLIFSRQGHILYSDLQTANSCLGIVTLLSNQTAVLLVSTAHGVQVWHWSAQAQRFQPPA